MSDDGHATYLVDAATCNPIELRTRGEGGGASLRFAIRVQLPGTDKNLQTLASRRRTPDAQVDTDPGRYDEALTRLSPQGLTEDPPDVTRRRDEAAGAQEPDEAATAPPAAEAQAGRRSAGGRFTPARNAAASSRW